MEPSSEGGGGREIDSAGNKVMEICMYYGRKVCRGREEGVPILDGAIHERCLIA